MFEVITALEARANSQLWLRFKDGTEGEVSFSDVIERGGVFESLADAATFRQARIGGGGRYVEWPGEIDFCADALHEKLSVPSLR